MTSWYPWVQCEPDILKFRVSLVPDTCFPRPLRLHSLLSLLRNGTLFSQPIFWSLLEKYLCSICALMTAWCSFSKKIHAKSPDNTWLTGWYTQSWPCRSCSQLSNGLIILSLVSTAGWNFQTKANRINFCFVIWLFLNATAYSFWFINFLVQWFLCAAVQNRSFSSIMFYIDTGNEM